MLRQPQVNDKTADSYVNLQLDGLARNILQRRMRSVYSHLTSGIRVRHNCALSLCASIAARNKQLTWELYRNFDFTLSTLTKLAMPPRTGVSLRQIGDRCRCGAQNAWGGLDPLTLSTREVYTEFVLSFFEAQDQALLCPVLARKVLLGNVLRFLACDSPCTIKRVLKFISDIVLSSDGNVPSRLQAALFGQEVLEQFAVISGFAADQPDIAHAKYGRGCDILVASDLAHDILNRLCTDPSHGICPESKSVNSRVDVKSKPRPHENQKMNDVPKRSKCESKGSLVQMKHNSQIVTLGKKGSALVRLLRKLKPLEKRRHADLLMTACTFHPQVATGYLPYAAYPLDPRPSVSWFISAMMVGRILLAASRGMTPQMILRFADSVVDREDLDFSSTWLPFSLNKAALTRGLQHSSRLVQHVSMWLNLHVLRYIRSHIDQLKEAVEAMEEHESSAGAGLVARYQKAAKSSLPDPQVLLALHKQCRNDTFDDMGESDRHRWREESNVEIGNGDYEIAIIRNYAVVGKSGRVNTLNALAEYTSLVGIDGLLNAKIDPVSFLSIAPFNQTFQELAATMQMLFAIYGVHRLEVNDMSLRNAFLRKNRTLCTAAYSRTSMQYDRDVDRRILSVSNAHLSGLLMVSALTPVSSIRNDAAHLAANHMVSCGALDNIEIAQREADTWLRYIPNAPIMAAEATCSFLSEAINTAARRRGFCLDEGLKMIMLNAYRRSTWSHVVEDKNSRCAQHACVTHSRPMLSTSVSRSFCEDIGISSLMVNALLNISKILRSSKRTCITSLAIATYLSSVLFDILQQQNDPSAMSALIVNVLQGDTDMHYDDHPKPLVSLLKFSQMVIQRTFGSQKNAGVALRGVNLSHEFCGIQNCNHEEKSINDMEARHLIRRVSKVSQIIDDQGALIFKEFASVPGSVLAAATSYMSSSSGRIRNLAHIVLRAHGPIIQLDFSRPSHSLSASDEFVVLLGSILHSAMHGCLPFPIFESTQYALNIGTIRDAFCSAVKRMEAEEVAKISRKLKFWRVLASAKSIDFLCSVYKRKHTDQARKHNTSEGWIGIFFALLLQACDASLARARDFARHYPCLAQISRQNIFGSSGLKCKFPLRSSCLQAAFADLIVSEIYSGHGIGDSNSLQVPNFSKFTYFFRHMVGNTLMRNVDGSMIFWMVHVLRHFPMTEKYDVIACMHDFHTHIATGSPLMLAFAVEIAAMMLSEPTSVLRGDDHFEAKAICSALQLTIIVIVSFDNLSDFEGTRARACRVAVTSLKSTPVKSFCNFPNDFLSDPMIKTMLNRAITSFDSDLLSLATAIAWISLPHAKYLTSLINDLNGSNCTIATQIRLSTLFPVVQAIIESHKSILGDTAIPTAIRSNLPTPLDGFKNMCSVFCCLAAQYLKLSNSFVSRQPEQSHNIDPTLTVMSHAAKILAGTFTMNTEEIIDESALIEIMFPTEGWLGSNIEVFDQGGASVEFVIGTLAEYASAVRMMFHEQKNIHPATHHSYITCLTSTLRMLALIIPQDAARANMSSPLARAAAVEWDLIIDLDNLLGLHGYLAARQFASVVSLRAFARAILRRRCTCVKSLALLNCILLAHTKLQCVSEYTRETHKVLSPRSMATLVSLARETFELAASQLVSTQLRRNSMMVSPANVKSLRIPLQSILEVIDCPSNSKGILMNRSCIKDTSESKLPPCLERVRFFLISLMCVSWNLQNDAIASIDRQTLHTISRNVGHRISNTEQSSAYWKAEQAGLIPLLAVAHGATLSRCDRQIAELIISLDNASGGGILAKIGYLWGDAAAYLFREPELSCYLDLVARKTAHGTRFWKKACGWVDAVRPEMVATALRHCEPPDIRRNALSVVHFVHARPLFQARSNIFLDHCHLHHDHARGANLKFIECGYNPAWVLPFAFNSLKNETMSLRECIDSGLLSLAFASTASIDPGMRYLAYAILNVAHRAARHGSSFREQKQIMALFASMRNALAPSDCLRRMPIPTALLAAEAAVVSLHPGAEIFPSMQHMVIRRASLGTSALPVAFLALLNGSSGKEIIGSRNHARTLRLWVLRLLLASCGGMLDETRLLRKSFAAETLMSQRFAPLSTDPFAQQLMLSVVVRATESSYARKQLIDGSGILSWLGGVIFSAFHPTCTVSVDNTLPGIQTAGIAISALLNIVGAKGVLCGGHLGAASDMLSALRDIRVSLEVILATFHQLESTEIKISVCQVVVLPALRLYSNTAKHLSRRHSKVLNVSEVANLCLIVDAMLASIPKDDDHVVQSSFMLVMFDIIVCSSEVRRDYVFFATRKYIQQAVSTTARSFTFIVAWAAKSVAKNGDDRVVQHCASIALHWATSFICDAGPVLLSEVVRTIDDGQIDGSTKVCKYLISLRTAAGTIDNLMTTFELMRAQATLIRGLVSQYEHDSSKLATEDKLVGAVVCHPVYKKLLLESGTLDRMLAEYQPAAIRQCVVPAAPEVQSLNLLDPGEHKLRSNVATMSNKLTSDGFATTNVPQKGNTSANHTRLTAAESFATALLHAVFNAEPPSNFLRRAAYLVECYEHAAVRCIGQCDWFLSVKLLLGTQ